MATKIDIGCTVQLYESSGNKHSHRYNNMCKSEAFQRCEKVKTADDHELCIHAAYSVMRLAKSTPLCLCGIPKYT